jgi:hypothetical protein
MSQAVFALDDGEYASEGFLPNIVNDVLLHTASAQFNDDEFGKV